MSEPYQRQRRIHQNVSGNVNLTTASTTQSIQTCPSAANRTIYLQKAHIEITASSAGKTWSLQDTAGAPIIMVGNVATDSVAKFDFDFGPEGIPLTQGKDLQVVISAAGAGGWVSWEAFAKRTVVSATL